MLHTVCDIELPATRTCCHPQLTSTLQQQPFLFSKCPLPRVSPAHHRCPVPCEAFCSSFTFTLQQPFLFLECPLTTTAARRFVKSSVALLPAPYNNSLFPTAGARARFLNREAKDVTSEGLSEEQRRRFDLWLW